MLRLFAPALALVVLFSPRTSYSDETTLAEVVRLALARNERARIADLSVASADATVHRARAGFLPNVSLGGSETLRPYSVEQGGKTTVRSNAAAGTLTVTQPVLALTAFPLYEGAKHGLDAARYDAKNQRRQLSFDAARAFFGVLAQQRVLVAAERRLTRADASLADTTARAKAQLVSINDVTRAAVERATAAQTRASAKSALEQSRINLEYLVDAEVSGTVRPPPNPLTPPISNVAQLIEQAVAQRPDLASARAAAAAASSNAEEPSLRFVPTLGAQAQARVADAAIAGDRYWDTTLLLSLGWAIWDAGLRSADAQSRNAAADVAKLQLQALKRKIAADLRNALSALAAAHEVLTAAEEGVGAARTSADETNVLYAQGLAKAIELLNANQSRFDAEVSLAAAQLSLQQAELDLRAALGLFPIDGVK